MNKLISNLKKNVILASGDPNFIHHKWFVKYHLLILEKIALELCDIYKEADKNLVLALVWVHDYGKILGFKDDMNSIVVEVRKLMSKIGFDHEFIEKTIKYLEIFESKMEIDLSVSPIEVQIASSSDAASHMIGPFYSLWWLENPTKPFEELMEDNKRKAMKDWDRKITLPEIRKKFISRHNFILENSGDIPNKFIK